MMNSSSEGGSVDSAKPKKEDAPKEEKIVAPKRHDVEGNPDVVDVEIVGADALQDGTMMELRVGGEKKDNVLISRF